MVSRSMSMELRKPSSLAAAAMAEMRRRSSSGGRLSGCDSCVRELRFEEEKKLPVFEAVDDERL